jgi:dolichyl-phosphate beta-glucosyltransferase
VASVVIVVPCYNEEKRLDLASFHAFKHPSHSIKFLFVNDGSSDNTLPVLESLRMSNSDRFIVLSLRHNQGKGEAVRQGIMAALDSQPDYVGFWDADLATPLNTISEFIDFAEKRPEVSMIIGARVKLLGREIQRKSSRHYLGRIFATVASAVLGLAVYQNVAVGHRFVSATIPIAVDLRRRNSCPIHQNKRGQRDPAGRSLNLRISINGMERYRGFQGAPLRFF